MIDTARLLCAITYTEPITFNQLLTKLQADQVRNNIEWRSLLELLEALEQQELITIERYQGRGRIHTLQLTDLGAERAAEALTGRNRCPACVHNQHQETSNEEHSQRRNVRTAS